MLSNYSTKWSHSILSISFTLTKNSSLVILHLDFKYVKRRSIIIIVIICIIVIIGGSILAIKHTIFSFPQNQNSSLTMHQPKNNFYTFPNKNPQFSVRINSRRTSASSSYIRQQSITIYKFGHEKDKSVFQRNYNPDGFKGDELTYIFATDSASFQQQGTLEKLDCSQADCSLPWTNYYTWDANKNTFVIDNTSHSDEFTQLLNSYQAIDTQEMSSANNTFVLKAEKVIQEVINGENLSSNDIRSTSL